MWIKGLGLIKDAAKRPTWLGRPIPAVLLDHRRRLTPLVGALTQLYLMTCRGLRRLLDAEIPLDQANSDQIL
jgi:hypothetical protein